MQAPKSGVKISQQVVQPVSLIHAGIEGKCVCVLVKRGRRKRDRVKRERNRGETRIGTPCRIAKKKKRKR